jgi:hypothetical protein
MEVLGVQIHVLLMENLQQIKFLEKQIIALNKHFYSVLRLKINLGMLLIQIPLLSLWENQQCLLILIKMGLELIASLKTKDYE